MTIHSEITKEIVIKMLELSYIPKSTVSQSTSADVALDRNIKRVTDAYKEIFQTVNNPMP